MSESNSSGGGGHLDELTLVIVVVGGLFLAHRLWERTLKPWAVEHIEMLRRAGLDAPLGASTTVADVLVIAILASPLLVVALWVRSRRRRRAKA